MSGSGLSALIRLGASLENDWGMETIACGRGALADEDCVLEICGRWLAFRIALHGPRCARPRASWTPRIRRKHFYAALIPRPGGIQRNA